MGNCLVTKLRESVGEDLPILGELVLQVDSDTIETDRNYVQILGATSARVFGGIGYIGADTPDQTTFVGNTFRFSAGHYFIGVKTKYDVEFIIPTGGRAPSPDLLIDLNDCEFLKNRASINVNTKAVKNKVIPFNKMYKLSGIKITNTDTAGRNILSGNCNDIRNNVEIDIFTINAQKDVVLNIENLATCVRLKTVNVSDCTVSGEIDTLASAIASNKANGDTLKLKFIGDYNSVTDDGNLADATYIRGKGGQSANCIKLTFDGIGGYTKSYEAF